MGPKSPKGSTSPQEPIGSMSPKYLKDFTSLNESQRFHDSKGFSMVAHGENESKPDVRSEGSYNELQMISKDFISPKEFWKLDKFKGVPD